jgi:hypothetical protein
VPKPNFSWIRFREGQTDPFERFVAKAIDDPMVMMLNRDPFGEGADGVAFLVVDLLEVFEELLLVPFHFRDVDQVRPFPFREHIDAAGEPASVPAHDFDEDDLAFLIGGGIHHRHLHHVDDVAGGRRIADRVIGHIKVVVDGLRDPEDLNVHLLGFEELGKLEAGIHRIVAAIDENIADIVLLDRLDDFIKEGIADRREFLAGAAEGAPGVCFRSSSSSRSSFRKSTRLSSIKPSTP